MVEPTEGHDMTFGGCRWEIMAKFIEKGSVDGLDVSCLEKLKPAFGMGN